MNPYDELEGNDDDDFEMPERSRKVIPAADLELLRLAARAIGAELEEVDGEEWVNLHFEDGSIEHHWNPLVHGDNTFALGVKLRLFEEHPGFLWILWDERVVTADPVAAAMRATVRAAAEIGKNR